MAERAAFTPKAGFTEPDALGTVFVDETADFNVREAIETGKGYIIADTPSVIAALDRYPALKRAAVTEAEEAQNAKSKTSRPTASSGDNK